MNRRSIIKTGFVYSFLLIVILFFGVTSALAAEKIIMRVGHGDAVDTYKSRKHSQMLTFKELVNANSNGRIEVQLHGGGSVGSERELCEAVIQGTMHASSISASIGPFYPPEMVLGIPYLFPNSQVAWDVLDGPFGKKLSEGLVKKQGIRNLAFGEVGFRNFTNNKRPIRTPKDLQGLKIRVMETPLYINMVKALGAGATPVPWTEVYTALQQGTVDGQENPVAVILSAKLQEVQKYITLDGHTYAEDWFIVNEKFYQSLPKDLQKVVRDAAEVSATVSRGVQQLNSAIGVAELQKAGVQVYVPTPQEKELFRKATQKPVIDWLKTKIDPKLIDEAFKAVAEASKKHP